MDTTPQLESRVRIGRVLFAGALFLVAFLLLCLVIYQVSSARADTAAASNAFAQKVQQEQFLQSAASLAADTQQERQALQTLAVPQNGGADFIAQLESLGTVSGVTTKVSSVLAKGPVGVTPGSLVLSVTFSGSFASCLRFLKLVETMPIAISFSSVSFQYDDSAKNWDGAVTLSALSFDTP